MLRKELSSLLYSPQARAASGTSYRTPVTRSYLDRSQKPVLPITVPTAPETKSPMADFMDMSDIDLAPLAGAERGEGGDYSQGGLVSSRTMGPAPEMEVATVNSLGDETQSLLGNAAVSIALGADPQQAIAASMTPEKIGSLGVNVLGDMLDSEIGLTTNDPSIQNPTMTDRAKSFLGVDNPVKSATRTIASTLSAPLGPVAAGLITKGADILGEGLADVTNTRPDETQKDFLEDEFGYTGGKKAYNRTLGFAENPMVGSSWSGGLTGKDFIKENQVETPWKSTQEVLDYFDSLGQTKEVLADKPAIPGMNPASDFDYLKTVNLGGGDAGGDGGGWSGLGEGAFSGQSLSESMNDSMAGGYAMA